MKFVYASGSQPLAGYTIKRGVGIGGFGEVYFATSDAGKEVALKRIQRNLDVEVRGVTQCLNLKHANLVALYDIKYDAKGEGWIVMEYVGGETLKDVLDRNPNGLPVEQVDSWFHAIAAGVNYLHNHGIVHRDLKPGNIFDDEGVVKIGDYGLSKFISCSRRSGQTESVGTFHYMAPEIGKGVYGKEIDVYALGIMLYELLTGCVPFDGESSQEIIMKHLTAEPDLRDLPQPYAEVIRRALLKDPAKRYSNVEELLVGLQIDKIDKNEAETSLSEEAFVNARVIDAAEVDKPPVTEYGAQRETIYITEENADAMVFGPVRESLAGKPSSAGQVPIASAFSRLGGNAVSRPGGLHAVPSWLPKPRIPAPVKLLVVLGALVSTVWMSQTLIPLGLLVGVAGLVFLGMRTLLLKLQGSSQGMGGTVSKVQLEKMAWQEQARKSLASAHLSDRLGELSFSLFVAAGIALALSCSMMLLVLGVAGVDEVANFTWLAISSAAAAWVVLVLSKFWEGGSGDQVVRRSTLVVAGVVVGGIAYLGGQFLAVDFTLGPTSTQPTPYGFYPVSMFDSELSPALPAYLFFFAGLFGLLRWWNQADPTRATRFSLGSVLIAVLWSFALPLPQPWGLMMAATASTAIQLAAPWMTIQKRIEIRDQMTQQLV